MYRFERVTALFFALALAGAASAQDTTSKVDRLTDTVIEALPVGSIFDMAAAGSEHWPMQERPDAVTPEQLACLRGELSSAGYRRAKRVEVQAYAEANPSRVDEDLRLLESGAAMLMGKLVLGGAGSAQSGSAFDERDVLRTASNEQALSLMTFMTDPNYAGLRKLSGIGDVFNPARSEHENKETGHQLGYSLGAQYVIKAMGACDIPPSAYL